MGFTLPNAVRHTALGQPLLDCQSSSTRAIDGCPEVGWLTRYIVNHVGIPGRLQGSAKRLWQMALADEASLLVRLLQVGADKTATGKAWQGGDAAGRSS